LLISVFNDHSDEDAYGMPTMCWGLL
jgi:hypothetical protein